MAAEEPRSQASDFFSLRGFVKHHIFAQRSRSADFFRNGAKEVFSRVDKELYQRACDAVPKRLKKCIKLDGVRRNCIGHCYYDCLQIKFC